MLREHGAAIRQRRVGKEEDLVMAREYETGATIAELERRFGLSHGAVLRSCIEAELR